MAGLAINLPRTAQVAELVIASWFAVGMSVFELPHAFIKPTSWGGWQQIAESTAMALGGVFAWTQTSGAAGKQAVKAAARLAFGVCLLVFGGSHFVYSNYTASLVPVWLPPSQIFWAYATGMAQIAAALALLSAVQARLAAVLLTLMYVGFGLLVQAPSVVLGPSSQNNWVENSLNLVLIGAAWALAETLSTPSMQSDTGGAGRIAA